MIGTLNIEEIEEVLYQNFVGRIGCHANGRTYIIPLSYAYDSGYIYVRSFGGLKIDIMRQNASICFEVDNMIDMSNWKSVIAWGEFEELTNNEERNKALRILMERKLPALSSKMVKLSKAWPFYEEDNDDIPGIVFRVLLVEKTGRFELNNASYPFII